MNTTLLPLLESIDDEIISSIQDCLHNDPKTIDDGITIASDNAAYVWILSIICSAIIGLSGLLPVFFTPESAIRDVDAKDESPSKNPSCTTCHDQYNHNDVQGEACITENSTAERKYIKGRLKYMLCFAVGSLLGDVFLHLLPEAYHKLYSNATIVEDPGLFIHNGHITIGVWSICGILTFVLIEMLYTSKKNCDEFSKDSDLDSTCHNQNQGNLSCASPNNESNQHVILKSDDMVECKSKKLGISGYLNILANGVDNFFNGLGVGAAFLTSPKVGITTTLCILVHEIPNGMGDFAILIKSGFSRYDTALAQLSIASIGIVGAFLALTLDTFNTNEEGDETMEKFTSWIIPFNCGGFINISLVTVLPDIMDSKDITDYLKTLGFIVLGIFSIVGISGL